MKQFQWAKLTDSQLRTLRAAAEGGRGHWSSFRILKRYDLVWEKWNVYAHRWDRGCTLAGYAVLAEAESRKR